MRNNKAFQKSKMKTTVIHHSADFDGIFCREIARKFLPDAELIGWDFKDPLIKMPAEGMVYILDLSPDCLDASGIKGIYWNRIVWIDHHKSSIEKYAYPKHPSIVGYRIDGVAACRLAWQWFTELLTDHMAKGHLLPEKQAFIDRTVSEPLAVRLAGEYDIWDKRDERTDVFQFGLRSRDLTVHDWQIMLGNFTKPSVSEIERMIEVGHPIDLRPDGTVDDSISTVRGLLRDGELLQRYQQRNDAGMMHRSFIVEFEGLKFLALTTARCNSLTFMSKDVPETGHDALMGFYFDGQKWNVSLYHAKHSTGIDLSQIAVKYGGGGHRGACGFRTDKIPFLKNL